MKPSATDGRSRIVTLTDEGRRRLALGAPLWREAQRQFKQMNGAANVTTLRNSLDMMVVGALASDAD